MYRATESGPGSIRVDSFKLSGRLFLDRWKKWWPNLELNQGHADFQSAALPTELFGHLLLFYLHSEGTELQRARIKTVSPLLVKF